jgi:hypothetical protein
MKRSSSLIAVCVACALALARPAIAESVQGVCKGFHALNVISPTGQKNILIGSYHAVADELRLPDDSIMNGVTRYVVEGIPEPNLKSKFKLEAQEVLQRKSPYADWASDLSPSQKEELRRRLACIKVGAPMNYETSVNGLIYLLSRQSPGAAYSVAIYPCSSSSSRLSLDGYMAKLAETRHLIPTPLEDQVFAEGQREKIPDEIYRYLLDHAFDARSEEGQRRAIAAINRGAYDDVLQVIQDLSESPASSEQFIQVMITDRNRAWMPRLTPLLDQGHTLINVGAAHLAGPNGLVSLLEERGYQVEPTCFPVKNDQ